MRALIVCATTPPAADGAEFGGDRRTRLFIEGIARVCDTMAFLYLVPASFAASDQARYAAKAVWGVEGASTFAPIARRRETLANHYLAPIADARHGKMFFPFVGQDALAAVRAALEDAPDFIFVRQLYAMLPFFAAPPAAPVLFDLDDLLHRVHWRAATVPPLRLGQAAMALQIPAILAAERRAARLAARTCVCTPADARFLAWLGAGPRAVVVPNAVACPVRTPPVPTQPHLLFLGQYAYGPNALAAERLIRRVWPRVRQARPDARLRIAGGASESLPSAACPPAGVEFLGYVPDLDALYADARVVCCPIDVGGGTRLKLIEAAAHARPMVSTRIGAEGLDFRDGREILLRDDDAGIAAACVALLADDALCARLGTAARTRMIELYEAGAVRSQITRLVQDMVMA